MKKLNLKALELGASEVLTRIQLKNIWGGNEEFEDSGDTAGALCVSCTDASTCWNANAQCRESTSCPNKGKVCAKTWYV